MMREVKVWMEVVQCCEEFIKFGICAGQNMKMSSMYRASSNGWIRCVWRNLLRITDMKMLAMVGEKAVPIAVPIICWKINPANSK